MDRLDPALRAMVEATQNMQCCLCGTKKSASFGDIVGIGMVCHRCSFLGIAGIDGVLHPHCPPIPSDVSPDIIAVQQNFQFPTMEEFDQWVTSMGNNAIGMERVKEINTNMKIEHWYTTHEEELQLAHQFQHIISDPISFDVLEACARKHPPSSFHCPGITNETAEAIVETFRCLVYEGQCANCGRETTMKCSRCKRMSICGRDCQRSVHKKHKKYCKTTTTTTRTSLAP